MTDRSFSPATAPPPYGIAALVGGIVLAIYLATIAPTTQFWDTSEYIAAAKVLGIPHPPGNPLFVLMAHVWGMLPLAAHYALRINLFAAVTSAAASGLLFLVADRFLHAGIPARLPRLATACAGVLVGASSFTVWHQSVVNEKVYTVSLLFIALALWLAVRWGDLETGGRRDKLLLLVGYIVVLGSTNHMMGVLVVPAVATYVILTDWREPLRPWVVLFAALAGLAVFGKWAAIVEGGAWQSISVVLVVGALLYAAWRDPGEFRRPLIYLAVLTVLVGISLNYTFLPIRSGLFPAINEGEPTNWQALLDVLNRVQYQKPPVTQRMADFGSQLLNYWQYFTWQFARDATPPLRHALAVGFLALGLWGGIDQWSRDRRGAVMMTVLIATCTVLLVYYLNFRYGFSIRPAEQLDREVRERDYFFVASFQLWGIWVALGLGSLLGRGHAMLRTRLDETPAWWAASPLLLVALIPLVGNRFTAPRAGETLARDFAVDLLQSVEPYGILITAGDNDLFPLWYAQEVEGVRRDVVVANLSLLNTDWHLRQILRREVDRFDLVDPAVPYREYADLTRPDGPPLDIPIAQVESLPLIFPVEERSVFRAGSVNAVLEQGAYTRAELLSLQFVAQNLGERPVYFARTTGPTADRLGLTPYLLTQGLVRRVMPEPVEPSDSVVAVQGLGWVDMNRTETLLFDVYHPESAARARPRGWVDPPSQNVLSAYYVTYALYADIVQQLGDSVETERARLGAIAADLADRMVGNLQIGQ